MSSDAGGAAKATEFPACSLVGCAPNLLKNCNLPSWASFFRHRRTAMPRYYIHIRTPNAIDRDRVGVECRSLADARAFASAAVMQHVNEGAAPDLELVASSSFEIVNEDGRKEMVLPFADILPEAEKK
jgi:hypothetical protein